MTGALWVLAFGVYIFVLGMLDPAPRRIARELEEYKRRRAAGEAK